MTVFKLQNPSNARLQKGNTPASGLSSVSRRIRRAQWPEALLLARATEVIAGFAILAGLAVGCDRASRRPEPWPPAGLAHVLPVRGVLRVASFGENGKCVDKLTHESTYVNGGGYRGMEDNDIRGFPDGTYVNRWNQVSQIHVRVGRKGSNPQLGEYELFRILQRWERILLPPHARITDARLALSVEKGPDAPALLLLYAARQDWNPGSGGVAGNNNSPPRAGGVWWEERAAGEQSWGLPGAGFASDRHPDADTESMPLAAFLYEPKDATIEFHDPRLTRYLARQIRAQEPALFVLKLSDRDEVRRGSRITLYSSEFGDDFEVTRRPQLRLAWEACVASIPVEKRILLEPGRSLTLGPFPTRARQMIAVAFGPEAGSEDPHIELRGRRREETMAWLPGTLASLDPAWDAFELRITAATHPIELGDAFVAELRDTWVRNAPPEDQSVAWQFVAPTGETFASEGAYRGDFTWRMEFRPQVPGRWHYRWSYRFAEEAYESRIGTFDVITRREEQVIRELERLLVAVRSSEAAEGHGSRRFLSERFAALEAEAMLRQTPETFRSQQGKLLMELLAEIRGELTGSHAP